MTRCVQRTWNSNYQTLRTADCLWPGTLCGQLPFSNGNFPKACQISFSFNQIKDGSAWESSKRNGKLQAKMWDQASAAWLLILIAAWIAGWNIGDLGGDLKKQITVQEKFWLIITERDHPSRRFLLFGWRAVESSQEWSQVNRRHSATTSQRSCPCPMTFPRLQSNDLKWNWPWANDFNKASWKTVTRLTDVSGKSGKRYHRLRIQCWNFSD